MTTFTYTKPTVGGSEDTWGDTLNANWDAVAAFIGPLDSTELAVLDGITATTAELNILDGVTVTLADITATATELNLLDGVTATTAEINYLDGVTSNIQTQLDAKAADNELTQVEVEDDTSTVFGQVSGQRLAQAVAANVTNPSYSEISLAPIEYGSGSGQDFTFLNLTSLDQYGVMRLDIRASESFEIADSLLQIRMSNDNGATWSSWVTIFSFDRNSSGSFFGYVELVDGDIIGVSANSNVLVGGNANAFQLRVNGPSGASASATCVVAPVSGRSA